MSLKPLAVRWEIYICSACVQNVLVVVAIKVDVQVVIFGVVIAFIPFCDFMRGKKSYNFQKNDD